MDRDALHKLAVLGVWLLVGAVLVVLSDSGAPQYEISLYHAYPGYFWLFVVGAMLCGSLVILGSARLPKDRSWLFGLLIVIKTNALLLSLPYVRGYQMIGRADAMSHLGFTHDIFLLGSIDSNIYPPMHVLMAALSDATGTEVATVGLVIPLVFSGLYFAGMFYLLVFLFDSREEILFGLPFVMLPILGRVHVGLRPFDVSILFLPLVLYLFFRSQRVPTPSIRGVFVVALIGLLLYHPLTALLVLGVFGVYMVAKATPGIKNQYAAPTSFVSISTAVFLAWYSNFTSIIFRFMTAFETLSGDDEGRESPADGYAQAAEQASPPLSDTIRVVTFNYGVDIILFTLGFLFVAVLCYLFLRQVYSPDIHLMLFVGSLVLFSFGGLFFLFLDLLVPHSRPFQIAKIAGGILAGQCFYLCWRYFDWSQHRPRAKRIFDFSLIFVVTILVGLTIFSLYTSPLGSSANSQVTEMEMEGTEWLTEHGEGSDDVAEFGISYRRFYHAQYGVQPDIPLVRTGLPDHFNYREYDYLGESYEDDTYLTLTSQARLVYPEVFPDYREHWRFTPESFDRLERDHSTDRIYDNGDYNQYLIDGMADEPFFDSD